MIQALYGGYVVKVEHGGETYHIKVKEGVRGMDIPASAELVDGVWHVSSGGKALTVVEVMKLVPAPLQGAPVADFSIKPSDVVKGLFGSVWQNCEKETVAMNLCKLSRFKNGDSWAPFTWEDYTEFCSHDASVTEFAVLEHFAEAGYLKKDDASIYHFTRKMIGVYMQCA